MSSDALALVEEVRRGGGTISLRDDGSLELRGDVPDHLVERLRARKPEVAALLRCGVASRAVDADVWRSMSRLGVRFGETVEVGEPWGTGTLWGMTPRGPIIDVGRVLVTFDFKDVA